jgi:hypothetical protein
MECYLYQVFDRALFVAPCSVSVNKHNMLAGTDVEVEDLRDQQVAPRHHSGTHNLKIKN